MPRRFSGFRDGAAVAVLAWAVSLSAMVGVRGSRGTPYLALQVMGILGMAAVAAAASSDGGLPGPIPTPRKRRTDMPVLSLTSSRTLEAAANLSLREGDVFICSYPKRSAVRGGGWVDEFRGGWCPLGTWCHRIGRFTRTTTHSPSRPFRPAYPDTDSGTTWMQNIVVALLTRGAEPAAGGHISMFAPFFGRC